MDYLVSPLAPKTLAKLPDLAGVRLASKAVGIKYQNRDDLLLVCFDKKTTSAGIFTKSACPSAPVDWCRSILPNGEARALVVNSGNANAFTGQKGQEAAKLSAQAAAKVVGCASHEVYLASTGVIGEPLDPAPFDMHLGDMARSAASDQWESAARAIMTTDTYPKLATRTCVIEGKTYNINGIAKGSGMIAPDMATMLAFIFTDAPISSNVLQSFLKQNVNQSFNAISVDSDTSTSDTVLAFANGTNPYEDESDPVLESFKAAFFDIQQDLALQIVRDGEGATKLVSITVEGAVSDDSAKKIAFAVANSPLVKTAIAGEDANWGRIVMAVGKAGEPADRDKLSISFGDIQVALNGERNPNYIEADTALLMKNDEINIKVDIGLKNGTAKVWTCDLTKKYVAINGDYRS